MWSTRAWVRGARTLRAVLVAPPDVQKCPSIVLLKESSCPLFVNVVRVIGDDPIWRWLTLFFSFFSLLSQKITTWPFWLLVFQLQSLFFWFLIFDLNPFVEVFICFQFHHSILIYHILYSMWSSFFQFLFFFLSLFVKDLVVFNFIFQLKLMVLHFLI